MHLRPAQLSLTRLLQPQVQKNHQHLHLPHHLKYVNLQVLSVCWRTLKDFVKEASVHRENAVLLVQA